MDNQDKIKKIFAHLKTGKPSDYGAMELLGLGNYHELVNELIPWLGYKSNANNTTEPEFLIYLHFALKHVIHDFDFDESDKQFLFNQFTEYIDWWRMHNYKFKSLLKEIKPLIKKEMYFKPESFEGCLNFWYEKYGKNDQSLILFLSRELLIEYLQFEKSNYLSNVNTISEQVNKEDESNLQLDTALLEKTSHRIALLFELGIIDLITTRIEEAGSYSDHKCAQLVAEIMGVTDSSVLKTISGYIRGLRNPHDERNYPLTQTSRKKVIAVLSKVNIEIQNF
jgi:hypothetical protein